MLWYRGALIFLRRCNPVEAYSHLRQGERESDLVEQFVLMRIKEFFLFRVTVRFSVNSPLR